MRPGVGQGRGGALVGARRLGFSVLFFKVGVTEHFAPCPAQRNCTINPSSHHLQLFLIHLMNYIQGSLQSVSTQAFEVGGVCVLPFFPVVSQNVGSLINEPK